MATVLDITEIVPFIPLRKFSNTVTWVSDVLATKNSEEQFSVQSYPREHKKVTYRFRTLEEFTYAKHWFYGHSGTYIGVPQWEHYSLKTGISAGTTFIPTTSDEGRLPIQSYGSNINGYLIIYENINKYEVRKISNFSSNLAILSTPVSQSYSNCFVAPVYPGFSRTGFIVQENRTERTITAEYTIPYSFYYTPGGSGGYLEFEDYFEIDYGSVWIRPKLMLGSLQTGYRHELNIFDTDLSIPHISLKENKTRWLGEIQLASTSYTELYKIYKQFQALSGRSTIIYIPTGDYDFKPIGGISAGSDLLQVEGTDMSTFGLKNIHITSKNTIIRNTDPFSIYTNNYNNYIIVDAWPIGDGSEYLQLSETQTYAVSDIIKIELLLKCRLDTDSVTFDHETNEICTVKVPIIEVP